MRLFAVDGVAEGAASGTRLGSGSPKDDSSPTAQTADPSAHDAALPPPDGPMLAHVEELGLYVVGQLVEPARAVLACRVVEPDQWCRNCGGEGAARDTVTRRLAHEPLWCRPTTLDVTVRRYRCAGCGHVWRQDTTRAAQTRAKVSRRGLRWALEGVVCRNLTVARVAEALGVSWNTANDAVLTEGERVLLDDPGQVDGIQVIGVEDRVWQHDRRGDTYVTVIVDLTGVRNRTDPPRLLDMVPGHSAQAFPAWFAARPGPWRVGVQVVGMNGLTGGRPATTDPRGTTRHRRVHEPASLRAVRA